jgi:hypothetical protein
VTTPNLIGLGCSCGDPDLGKVRYVAVIRPTDPAIDCGGLGPGDHHPARGVILVCPACGSSSCVPCVVAAVSDKTEGGITTVSPIVQALLENDETPDALAKVIAKA